jgi:glycosyltransferase involved in cell wall biosynthesis
MKLLLVYPGLQVGGIETLIVRMARALADRGHQVWVLLGREGDPALMAQLRRSATVLLGSDRFFGARRSLRGLPRVDADFVYCMSAPSLLVGLAARDVLAPRARLLAGAYFPREYCPSRLGWRYQDRLAARAFAALPAANAVFMNTYAAREHGEALERDFGASPVVPIAVEVERFGRVERRPDLRRAVSIGRLTDFKTYSFHMVDVVRRLRARGLEVEYHHYGDGEERDRLRRHVEAAGMERYVVLHGGIPYQRMEEVLGDAGVFVGMGTAAIEAAAAGVPTVVALESSPTPASHGFLHELPAGNAGELIPGAPVHDLGSLVERALRAGEAEYRALSDASRRAAGAYSAPAVVDRFEAALAASEAFAFPIGPLRRLAGLADAGRWKVLRRLGRPDPLDGKYLRPGVTA